MASGLTATSPYIKISQGPSLHYTDHYVTTYSLTHRAFKADQNSPLKQLEHPLRITPFAAADALRPHYFTSGYTKNVIPVVAYDKAIDENKHFSTAERFDTMNKTGYPVPYSNKIASIPPTDVLIVESGFTNQKDSSKNVIGTERLHLKMNNKNSTMKAEYPKHNVSLMNSDKPVYDAQARVVHEGTLKIGKKTGTAYTHDISHTANDDPSDLAAAAAVRPATPPRLKKKGYPIFDIANSSISRVDMSGYSHPDGVAELLASQKIGLNSMHSSLISKLRKTNPTEYLALSHPNQTAAGITRLTFDDPKSRLPALGTMNPKERVGQKQTTGFLRDTKSHIPSETSDFTRQRFQTSSYLSFPAPPVPKPNLPENIKMERSGYAREPEALRFRRLDEPVLHESVQRYLTQVEPVWKAERLHSHKIRS